MKLKPIFLSLSLVVSTNWALAHGGDDHAHDEAPATQTVNKPQRLADGRVFVPKLTQYQLGLKTQLAKSGEAARTIELNGHVVMDPNRGARIQASSGGRVSAPTGGLPMLGSTVKKGQVLAHIQPAQSSFELAQQRAQLLDSRADLAQAERDLARLRELEGSVPRKEIETAQLKVGALRSKTAALAGASAGETLRAPIDGVLAASHVVNGQVLEPSTILFEIVDPKGFLIEALAYDPAVVSQINGAALNGVTLRYLGGASALRDGALPMLFAPTEVMPLALGQAVKVLAQTRQQSKGYVLPASAVVKNSSNQSVVWVLEQAQVLSPIVVQPMPVDGQRVMVSGLKDGQRVLVQGANLISQIR